MARDLLVIQQCTGADHGRKIVAQYRYKGAEGRDGEITVIEDSSMYTRDTKGNWSPGFEFIDNRTVKAHPFIIDALIENAERLWSMEEVLAELSG